MTEMVKMYTCQVCEYNTQRKDAFVRHQNSKKHNLLHKPQVSENTENTNNTKQSYNVNIRNIYIHHYGNVGKTYLLSYDVIRIPHKNVFK